MTREVPPTGDSEASPESTAAPENATTPENAAPERPNSVSRRGFLQGSMAAGGGLFACAAALSPLRDLDTEEFTVEKFLQKHYKEMTPQDMEQVLARISSEVEKRYEVKPELRDVKPKDGVEFVYALHLGRCIGCRRCVHACAPHIMLATFLALIGRETDLQVTDNSPSSWRAWVTALRSSLAFSWRVGGLSPTPSTV